MEDDGVAAVEDDLLEHAIDPGPQARLRRDRSGPLPHSSSRSPAAGDPWPPGRRRSGEGPARRSRPGGQGGGGRHVREREGGPPPPNRPLARPRPGAGEDADPGPGRGRPAVRPAVEPPATTGVLHHMYGSVWRPRSGPSPRPRAVATMSTACRRGRPPARELGRADTSIRRASCAGRRAARPGTTRPLVGRGSRVPPSGQTPARTMPGSRSAGRPRGRAPSGSVGRRKRPAGQQSRAAVAIPERRLAMRPPGAASTREGVYPSAPGTGRARAR